MDAEPLIDRAELTGYLFTVADISENLAAIRRVLEEDDGWEAEEES